MVSSVHHHLLEAYLCSTYLYSRFRNDKILLMKSNKMDKEEKGYDIVSFTFGKDAPYIGLALSVNIQVNGSISISTTRNNNHLCAMCKLMYANATKLTDARAITVCDGRRKTCRQQFGMHQPNNMHSWSPLCMFPIRNAVSCFWNRIIQRWMFDSNQELVNDSTHVTVAVFMVCRMMMLLVKGRAFMVFEWIGDMMIHSKGSDVQQAYNP